MRTIKVKFWNGKKMSNPYELLDMLYEGCPPEIADIEGELNTDPKFLKKIVVLQFTGLLDKSGKEIYEGDIVKVETKEIFLVAWYDNGACFRYYQMENENPVDTNSPLNYDDVEVIGNIYENKKLLIKNYDK